MPGAPDLDAFRSRCRSFLDGLDVEPLSGPDPRGDRSLAVARHVQGRLAEAGLAGVTYPVEYGGQGLTAAHERVWRDEYGRAPDLLGPLKISHSMCLPILNEFGTAQQKARHVARDIRAEDLWCQVFSEPEAGSDVAGLQMRAERDGDGWLFNDQKVWRPWPTSATSARAHSHGHRAAKARWFLDVHRRHAGVRDRCATDLADRWSNGVERGFLHRRGGEDDLVGDLHDGWRLATAMLSCERVAIGTGGAHPLSDGLLAAARARRALDDLILRQDLIRLYSEETVKTTTPSQVRAAVEVGRSPGPIGSLGKFQGALIARITRELAPHVLGMSTVTWSGESWGRAVDHVVTSSQASIAGGTDEIRRGRADPRAFAGTSGGSRRRLLGAPSGRPMTTDLGDREPSDRLGARRGGGVPQRVRPLQHLDVDLRAHRRDPAE